MNQLEKLLLMPDYFRALAKEWLNILFGETLVGIGFLIRWALGAPTNHALIVVFVAAMFVAGYYAWRPSYVRLIPQLDIVGTRLEDMPIPIDEHRGDVRTFCQLVPRCLTDSPVYECRGHLREMRPWSVDRWQATSLGPLILRWGNTQEVDADITWPAVFAAFPRQPGGVEAYQFDVCITYSQRRNGHLESIKPINVCLGFQMTNDLYHPHLELRRLA